MDSHLLQTPGVPLAMYDVPGLINNAHQRSMTQSNILPGLFPFDENTFDKDDTGPSSMTDRPNPEGGESTGTLSAEAGLSEFLSPQLFREDPVASGRE